MRPILNPEVYTREELSGLDADLVPKRIAIIMDGNRRWAKERGLSKEEGHRAGAEALVKLIRPAVDLGIHTLTVYGFSTENWFREGQEVQALLRLIEEYVLKEQIDAMQNDVQMDFIGKLEDLPKTLYDLCCEAREMTKSHKRARLVIALNYGGRNEILRSCQEIQKKILLGELTVEQITPDLISQHTEMWRMGGEPELLIRTSGERRISNFLLWQIPGAHYKEVDVCWPGFDKYVLLDLIKAHQKSLNKGNTLVQR